MVVNEKGIGRAIASQAVHTVGFPYSVSETFLRQNQGQSLEEAVEVLEKIKLKADEAGLAVVAYLSMAFGNPYGDPWNHEEVLEAVAILADMDLAAISLADTVGLAGPVLIADLVAAVVSKFNYKEIGVHLHSRPEQASEKVLATYDAGCRRFDSALGGLGGCPFAQDMLVGNLPTERVLQALAERGIELPIKKKLDALLTMSAEIAARHIGGAPS